MKFSPFFLFIAMLSLNTLSLASDNSFSKYPRVNNVDDLAILGEPRSIEESLILKTLVNEFAIQHLNNEHSILANSLIEINQKHGELVKVVLKQVESQGHLEEGYVHLEEGRELLGKGQELIFEGHNLLNEKIKDQDQKVKTLEKEVKKQNTIITGLTIATSVLAGYIIAKEIVQFSNKNSSNEN